jgi:hypothetical protein
VPLDIRHRLLNDAQNGSLQIERQVVYRTGDPYGDFEPGAPAEAIDELSQGCAKPLPLMAIGFAKTLPVIFSTVLR